MSLIVEAHSGIGQRAVIGGFERVAHSERSEGCGEVEKTTPFPLVRECHPKFDQSTRPPSPFIHRDRR
jgi:hypothetical protein